ncbi:MAG: hypothetical protein IIC04_01835, partial [Proteobacteria bacterium]|nr:hypothetical protein [Pseudomonadota bacterium]
MAARTPEPKKKASKKAAKTPKPKKKTAKKAARTPAAEAAVEETPEELRARNLEAFEKHMPQVHPFLVNHSPQSTLVYTEDGEPDVEFRGVRLYDGVGAFTYARKQLDTFWKNPSRLFFNLMDSKNLDSHAGLFGAKLMKRAMDDGFVFRKVPDSKDCYFMVIMGIGLAPHLKELIDETKCQHVIMFEPNMEFLYHSTFVFDWGELFEKFTGGRRDIHFWNELNNIHRLSYMEGDVRTRLFTIADWNPYGEFWFHDDKLAEEKGNVYIHRLTYHDTPEVISKRT